MIESIPELRKICQDTERRGDTSLTLRIHRSISIYITRLLLITPITANQTTLLDIAIGLIGCFFIATGEPLNFLIGCLILQFWLAFDCVDGEIARYRKTASITGLYVDRVNHIVIEPLIFVSLSIGVYFNYPTISVILLGHSAALSVLIGKLSSTNIYASVFDTKIAFTNNPEDIKRPDMNKSGFIPTLKNLTSNKSKLFSLAWFFFIGEGKNILFFLAALYDVYFKYISGNMPIWNNIPLYGSFGILVIYGFLSPFSWILLIYMTIKKQSCERLYYELFDEISIE